MSEVQVQYSMEGLPASLPDLAMLQVIRSVAKADVLVQQLRLVSKRVRDLVDIVLEERFKETWGVAGVAIAPPAAPAFAAARPVFVLCHRLERRETLAGLAVRHGTDVVALKRLNNLMSDGALASRSHLYVSVPDAAAAAAGQRVAFVHDTHSKRRLVVILREGEELPSGVPGAGGSSGGMRQPPGSSQEFVVAKLARVLERALKLDGPTAKYYVQQAECDVRAAIEKYEEDRRWERVMKKQQGRFLLRP